MTTKKTNDEASTDSTADKVVEAPKEKAKEKEKAPEVDPVVTLHVPGHDPNYVPTGVGAGGAPLISIDLWARTAGIRSTAVPGFRAWAEANTPGEHTAADWSKHHAKFLSTPVG